MFIQPVNDAYLFHAFLHEKHNNGLAPPCHIALELNARHNRKQHHQFPNIPAPQFFPIRNRFDELPLAAPFCPECPLESHSDLPLSHELPAEWHLGHQMDMTSDWFFNGFGVAKNRKL
jgi:hypothetical protein